MAELNPRVQKFIDIWREDASLEGQDVYDAQERDFRAVPFSKLRKGRPAGPKGVENIVLTALG